MHQFGNIAVLLLNLHFSALYPAHVKDVINQAQEMVARGQNLLQAVPDLILVVNVAYRNRCKPDNRVHRCPDVMGHI